MPVIFSWAMSCHCSRSDLIRADTSGRCSTVWIVVVPTPKSLAVAVRDMPSARRAATSLRKDWDGGLRVPLGRPAWRVDPYFRLGVVVGAAGEADDLEGSR